MTVKELTKRHREAQRIHEAHGPLGGRSIEYIGSLIKHCGLDWNMDRLMTAEEIMDRKQEAHQMWFKTLDIWRYKRGLPQSGDAVLMTKHEITERQKQGSLKHQYATWDRGMHPCFLRPEIE